MRRIGSFYLFYGSLLSESEGIDIGILILYLRGMKKWILVGLTLWASQFIYAQSQSQWAAKAYAYMEQDSLPQAEECFTHAITALPTSRQNAMLYANLGTVQRRRGKMREAIASYTSALERAPLTVSILMDRATAYMALGNDDKAYTDLCNVLEKDATHIEALYYRAFIYTNNDGTDIREEDIPADLKDKAEEYRTQLLEAIAESDDELFEKYLEGEELTEEEIHKAIRVTTIAGKMIPVLCGTSYRNKGVQKLLDAVVEYLPSPLDVPAITGTLPDTDTEEERPSSEDAPFAALAFKIATDPFVGKICFVRVYSGCIQSGSTVYNATKGGRERLGSSCQPPCFE